MADTHGWMGKILRVNLTTGHHYIEPLDLNNAERFIGGRGFIALAGVIFGKWNPLGAIASTLVFGLADAAQLRLQALVACPRIALFA